MIENRPSYVVDMWGEMCVPCDCCGHVTRSINGIINRDEATVAAYWIRWTEAHIAETGADFDFVIGAWGEDTAKEDRFAVKLRYCLQEEGPGSVMVVDASPARCADTDLASRALQRDEVIGTPLAPIVFALFDAVWAQDERLFRGDRFGDVQA